MALSEFLVIAGAIGSLVMVLDFVRPVRNANPFAGGPSRGECPEDSHSGGDSTHDQSSPANGPRAYSADGPDDRNRRSAHAEQPARMNRDCRGQVSSHGSPFPAQRRQVVLWGRSPTCPCGRTVQRPDPRQ
jgi:hypothetical protein